MLSASNQENPETRNQNFKLKKKTVTFGKHCQSKTPGLKTLKCLATQRGPTEDKTDNRQQEGWATEREQGSQALSVSLNPDAKTPEAWSWLNVTDIN